MTEDVNVLLIVLDSVRYDHMSTNGYDRPTTPEITEFTQDATRFENAFAAAPWTPPSHGAMFTGQYPSKSGITGLTPNYGPEQPHIAERLSNHGYRTLGFSNSYHTSPDRGFDRGFDYYHDILSLPRLGGKMYEPSIDYFRHLYDYFVNGYDDSAFQLNKIRTQLKRGDSPFFGFINLNSAHSPYNPPQRFKQQFEAFIEAGQSPNREIAESYSKDAYDYIFGDLEMSGSEWELVKCWYDGEIRYMDYLLGKFFGFLQSEGLYDNTMIILTSDHGEQFGEQGLVYHQFSLSEAVLHVPLLVKWPGQTTEQTSEKLVSLADITPTISSLVTGTTPDQMDGEPLNKTSDREVVFAEYAGPSDSLKERLIERGEEYAGYISGLQAIRTRKNKFVQRTDGNAALYDVSENKDAEISDDALQDELAQQLERTLKQLPTEGIREEYSEHVKDHLTEMGYL
jgi:arylsulfatase A-like enzyme